MTTVALADTLFVSADRLSQNEKGRLFDFVAKLRTNPAQPGLSMERVTSAKDPKVWSARISQDIRAILHRDGDVFSVLYAGRHDEAYAWAARRQIVRHEVTGALQIVESAEFVEERLAGPAAATEETPPFFGHYDDEFLLALGVPRESLDAVRSVNSDEGLDQLIDVLPGEAAERLIDLAAGTTVTPADVTPSNEPALEHPDSRRRFFVPDDEEELRRMLDAPLATWMAFLHPSQRSLVERRFNGPAKVTGSAGTGKTVVAMHRARHLARQGKRVLLTTYSRELGQVIERNLALLCAADQLSRITVDHVHRFALRAILRPARSRLQPPEQNEITGLITRAKQETGCSASPATLEAEWSQVIQAQGIMTWEEYRTASRAGRGTALSAADRRQWWEVFARVHAALERQEKLDWPALCRRALELITPQLQGRDAAREREEAETSARNERRNALQRELDAVERQAARAGQRSGLLGRLPTLFGDTETRHGAERRRLMAELTALEAEETALARRRPSPAGRPPWDFDAVVVDEVQDLGPQELRLLAAIAGDGPDRLMVIGDGGQRIYARRFSLRALGIEVRGRSRTLTINYRTTEQIRRFADRVTDEEGDDLEGGKEPRRACRSLLRGPAPTARGFATADDQYAYLVDEVRQLQDEGYALDEVAILARTRRLLESAARALTQSGIASRWANQPATGPAVILSTLHGAKGLEFKVVFVIDVSDAELPSPAALRGLTDAADIDDVHTRERQVLYVALTRARDALYVTWAGTPSRYLRDALVALDAGAIAPVR